MKLMGASMSPYVERVVIALAYKGQSDAVKMAELPGGFKSAEHLALSPMGRIPVFETADGAALVESQTICEYLDSVLDGPDVVPADDLKRAYMSIFCRIVDLDFAPAFGNLWPGRAASEEALKEAVEVKLPKAMDSLEFYASKGGLLAEGEPTLADAALMPFLFHMHVFGRRHGHGDFDGRPTLAAWQARVVESDIGKSSFARASEALKAFQAAQG